MRITSKGQVTIPAAIREKAGLLPHMEVEFACTGRGNVRVFRAAARNGKKAKASRGEHLVAHLKAHRGDLKMTTEQIMALTRGKD